MVSRAVVGVSCLGGTAGRASVAATSSSSAVDRSVRSGGLLRPLPRTLVLPSRADERWVRYRAAVGYAGPGSMVSHLSALLLWDLPVGAAERPAPPALAAQVDVLVPHSRRPRAGPESLVRVHRSHRVGQPWSRRGLPVVSLERAVVESWPLLVADAQRAPTIIALREGRTTPERLRREVGRHPRLPGRTRLLALVDVVEQGCHSELEVWGHRMVFVGPRFTHLERQVPVRCGARTVRFDLWDRLARVDVELDGRRYHSGVLERERDIARDAAVAEGGDLTLRFSHRRLTQDPAGCREQTWRVLVVRRRQLGAPPP